MSPAFCNAQHERTMSSSSAPPGHVAKRARISSEADVEDSNLEHTDTHVVSVSEYEELPDASTSRGRSVPRLSYRVSPACPLLPHDVQSVCCACQ